MEEVEITSRKILKPSSPTPPHLSTFKLSLLDQLSTAIHGNMTFFYPLAGPDPSALSLSLQSSLSTTLTRFYPFAGRLIDDSTVRCSDDGVWFVEARSCRPLSAYLAAPNFPSLDAFIPSTSPKTMELAGGSPLIVQFTAFSCGGVALGLSTSHKFNDIASFLTLVKSWSDTARGVPDPLMPEFVGASVLPPRDLPVGKTATVSIPAEKFSARRFVFSQEKIVELKARVGGHRRPTRVEVVLALIWRCAISAQKSGSGPSVMFQAANLRRRTDPPLPDTAMGNFIWPFMAVAETEMEMEGLVEIMRKAVSEFMDSTAKKFGGGEAAATVTEELRRRGEVLKKSEGMSIYKCTSWCRFPILDSADFGFGKPTWHYSVNKIVSNTIALMDVGPGDGVEALVTLDDDELAVFECNEELLKYACANPSVYDGP